MQVYDKLITIENSNLALGFFDGVHIGHKKIVEKLINCSKQNRKKSVVITFKNSPAEMFLDNVCYISTLAEKEKIFEESGVDVFIELEFNKELLNISCEDYLEKILYKYFKPSVIITGFNHTFGHNKKGTPDFLEQNQAKYGYEYLKIPPVFLDGDIVSSTLIRQKLSEGDVVRANELLGYEFSVSGEVITGNKIGRTIGFPTANILYPDKKVKIPRGVYSSFVYLNGKEYKGILNYGIKPTVNNGENKPVAEVHLLGFNEDIYGKEIRISVIKKIRDEKRFGSLEELKAQIKEDIEKC